MNLNAKTQRREGAEKITPMLRVVVFGLCVLALLAWVAMGFWNAQPIGDPHWREDGTYRAISN